jgi:PhnB protein
MSLHLLPRFSVKKPVIAGLAQATSSSIAWRPGLRIVARALHYRLKETIMATATKSIPDGYHSVTPYLIIKGAADAIDFYKKAFGAVELMRMPSPDGRIGHAEIKIGDSAIMLADEYPEMGYRSPQSLGGAGVSLMVYVELVDEVFKRALATGAKELQPVKDQFYGDRSGTLQDPYGHTWTIATHVEDIQPDEMRRRAEKFMQKTNA